MLQWIKDQPVEVQVTDGGGPLEKCKTTTQQCTQGIFSVVSNNNRYLLAYSSVLKRKHEIIAHFGEKILNLFQLLLKVLPNLSLQLFGFQDC